jgi:L-asparagine transporter-like permease
MLGIIPVIGGLFMGVDFFYGLSNQASIVRVVAIVILVIVFGLGFLIRGVRPNSPYFAEIKERRAQGIKGSDESGRTHDT